MTRNVIEVAGIGGDGIGQELFPHAKGLVRAGNDLLGVEAVRMDELPYGAEYYLREGKAWPDGEPARLARDYHAAFLIALGDPRVPGGGMAHAREIILDGFRGHPGWKTNLNNRPADLLHGDLRPEVTTEPFSFELVALSESDQQIDERVVGEGTPNETIYPRETHSLKAFEARLRAAARRAKQLGDNRVMVAHKANVMRYSHGPWKGVCERIAADEGVQVEQQLMDSLLERLLKNPQSLPNVIVTDRAFGAVLSRSLEAFRSGQREAIPEDFRIVLGRENTEGMYFRGGESKQEGGDTVGTQIGKHSRPMIEANIRGCIELARQKGQDTLTVLHLEDVHPRSYALWKAVAEAMTEEAGIAFRWMHAGDFVARLIRNPAEFNGEVFAGDNILGDICADATAALVGGMGIPATAQVNTTGETGQEFYEPLHGSAPDIAGQGKANPTATFLTVGELWSRHELGGLQGKLHAAMRTVLSRGIRTPDMGGQASTQEYADAVIQEFRRS